jgi:hypothetical protein
MPKQSNASADLYRPLLLIAHQLNTSRLMHARGDRSSSVHPSISTANYMLQSITPLSIYHPAISGCIHRPKCSKGTECKHLTGIQDTRYSHDAVLFLFYDAFGIGQWENIQLLARISLRSTNLISSQR